MFVYVIETKKSMGKFSEYCYWGIHVVSWCFIVTVVADFIEYWLNDIETLRKIAFVMVMLVRIGTMINGDRWFLLGWSLLVGLYCLEQLLSWQFQLRVIPREWGSWRFLVWTFAGRIRRVDPSLWYGLQGMGGRSVCQISINNPGI